MFFYALGYLLYFAARWVEPPMWALSWIDALKPTLGALGTAARVSDTPFPAQVVIVYCAIGSPLLTAWATYWMLLVSKSREIILHRTKTDGRSRWKLVCIGLGQLVFALIFITICVREHTGIIGWQMHFFFSPGFGSATMLLSGCALYTMTAPIALYWLWIGLTGYPRKHVISNAINVPIDQGLDAPSIVLKEGNHGQ